MAKRTTTDKPRIFISHAWENKGVVRRLEADLTAAGAEVWVDHVGIRGGDNLPERISEALEWCNTLLLLWSDAASSSRWVQLEWTNTIVLDKAIIPCKLSVTQLPAILAHKAYLDFHNIGQGISELLRALNLAQQPQAPAPTDDDVKTMLREKGFFASNWNNKAKGVQHQYETIERQGKKLVIDHTTGLTWQHSGSDNWMSYQRAEDNLTKLKKGKFGRYNDWRLPSVKKRCR